MAAGSGSGCTWDMRSAGPPRTPLTPTPTPLLLALLILLRSDQALSGQSDQALSGQSGRPGRAHAACNGTFVDAGANVGDSLHMWYMVPSCSSAPHKLDGGRGCAWQMPWWLPLSVRRTYCAMAFEPNPHLAAKLEHAAAHLRRYLGGQIDVFNGTALAEADGTAPFGLDLQGYNNEGSSLMLNKRTKPVGGRVGSGQRVGENKVLVRTVNALELLRAVDPGPIALKIDVEGYEGRLLRNLILSGVLCDRVPELFVEWHVSAQIDARDRGSMPAQTLDVYRWMLSTYNPNASALIKAWLPWADSTCNTTLLQWAR